MPTEEYDYLHVISSLWEDSNGSPPPGNTMTGISGNNKIKGKCSKIDISMNNKNLLTCCILSALYLYLIVKQGERKEVLYCDVQIYISWHHYKYKALAIRAGIDNVYLDNLCKSDT